MHAYIRYHSTIGRTDHWSDSSLVWQIIVIFYWERSIYGAGPGTYPSYNWPKMCKACNFFLACDTKSDTHVLLYRWQRGQQCQVFVIRSVSPLSYNLDSPYLFCTVLYSQCVHVSQTCVTWPWPNFTVSWSC
jgi:hypothetical protein